MLEGIKATAAGILRRAAAALDGDNTGVISPPDSVDRAFDDAADLDAPVPFQDPVTPEAIALLRARGPADTIPDAPSSDAMSAEEFFAAEKAALLGVKNSPIPRFKRRFLP